MAKNYLKSSLQNATFNIIFQVLFRCITFFLNAFVLRYVSQDVIGVMNVRLLLLESTILFLSREAFRRACLSKTSEHSWRQVINLLWFTVPLCQVLSMFFGYVWLHILVPPDTSITPHYNLGVWAICISCVIEMCCEPVYLTAQAFLFVRLKIVLETIYVIVRTVTFVPLVIYSPDKAVIAFSLAQVLSVCVYTFSYYLYFYVYIGNRNRHLLSCKRGSLHCQNENHRMSSEDDFPFCSLRDFLPMRIENQPIIDYSLTKLTWSFFKQGILKQVLTEGERYVMTLFSVLTFYEQGVYDIVNNLGSLAARFIFRPIEESSYFYFSQMVARDTAVQAQDQKHISETVYVLKHLLRCISSFGLVILVFGQSYSKLLLFLYGGQTLITGPGPLLMRTHCLAVLFLAVNGITECYALATMNTSQLDRFNYVMAGLSVSFLFVSWLFTTVFGGVGFIFANCCNMLARIIHSIKFIQTHYKGTEYKPLGGLIPNYNFLFVLFLSWSITCLSERYFFDSFKIIHLGVGIVCFMAVVIVWCYHERELVNLAISKYKERSKKEN
ncbi:hypothetical protein R5R35_009691 [Gryllus longicercus]|uniref:Protein RFT1 homolog n=1 Tax=Gryllus longicercus TaxID=2509291 RepID=A0AAN9VIA5_9ORTH